jgi:hypothetical protein
MRPSTPEGLPRPKWGFLFSTVAGAAFQKVSYGKKKGHTLIRMRFNATQLAQILVCRQDMVHALGVHMSCEYLREALPQVPGWDKEDRQALLANKRSWAPSAGYGYMGKEYLANALQPAVFVALLAGERGVDEAVLSAILPRDLQSSYCPAPPWLRLLTEVQGDVFVGVEPHGLFPLETGRVCVREGVPEEAILSFLTGGLYDLSFRLAQLFLPEAR